jgi:hypothetical protein
MRSEQLASLAAYAGAWLDPAGPIGPCPFGPSVALGVKNAVYVVCAWSGRILYVGSTSVGLRRRFTEHLRDFAKTIDWTTVYVIPLLESAPIAEIRRIEGRVGRATAPAQNRALPRL